MHDDLMVVVGSGAVALTDRRTRHTWTVELAPYLLAVVPVTQSQYAEVTDERPSAASGDDLPVECVSWLSAVRYCNALSERAELTPVYSLSGDGEGVHWEVPADGYRLPTEAEWEYACRAGSTGARYGQLADIAWYRGNSLDAIHHVGGKEPNPWGFHDMLGNVWEWCWDLYDPEGLWLLPGAPRGRVERRPLELPGIGAAPQPPDLPDRRRWLPGRPILLTTRSRLCGGLRPSTVGSRRYDSGSMEGQFFFTTVAGVSVSLAGFASLIAALREDSRIWDPINLWRVKTIVRQAITILFLALVVIPIFSITNDLRATTRLGAIGLLLGLGIDAFINRRPDPTIWVPRRSWTIAMASSALYAALQLVNLSLASLGILQLGFLLMLIEPAGIFSNFVRELGRQRHEPELLGEARAEG